MMTDAILRGSFRLRGISGKAQNVKLPRAAGIKPGGMANVVIADDNKLYIIWFKRVKGGWQIEGNARRFL